MISSSKNRFRFFVGLVGMVLVFLLVFVGCQQMPDKGDVNPPLKVSASGFDGSQQTFVPQTNYVAMPLPFAPFAELFQQLSANVPEKLISRGEAHVTVLTPPEYDQLKAQISIDEINAIALALGIQNVKVKPFCLGRGDAVIEGKREQTYYVVVEAEGLRKIRLAIAAEFVKRGGSSAVFDAEHFFPHVTVGFTKRDLFDQDGVVKDQNSCVRSLDF